MIGEGDREPLDHITWAPIDVETGADSVEPKLIRASDAARFEEAIGIEQYRIALCEQRFFGFEALVAE